MQSTGSELSEREREILYLVATGASNKEIAQHLSISTNTVKVHLRNIFAKIDARSRTEAAMYAVSIGLVREPSTVGVESEADQTNIAQPAAEIEQPAPKFNQRLIWLVGSMVLVLAATAILYTLFRPQPSQPPEGGGAALPRWQFLPPMLTARSGLASVAYEQAIYAIGGVHAQKPSGAVERFDLASETWAALSPKPTPVYEIGAAVISGKIYVPGGRLGSGQVTNILEIYDPRQDAWSSGAPLPVAVSGYGLAAFEGRLYLFGGWDGREYLASVYEYSPDQDRWMEKTAMPTRRAYLGVAQVGGSLYALGGYDGKTALGVNEVYKPDLDSGAGAPWSQATPLPERRYRMGVASSIDMLLLVGGLGTNDKTPYSFQYSVQSGEWMRFETPAASLPWYDLGATVMGTHLYLIGGEQNQQATDQSMAYQVLYILSLPVVPVQQP